MLGTRWVHVVVLLLTISARAFAFANFSADPTDVSGSANAGQLTTVPFDQVTLTNLTGSSLSLTITKATVQGGNWLSASYSPQPLPANGQSTLTITADASHLDPLLTGDHNYHGTVTIKSPNNNTTVIINVTLSVFGTKIMASPFPSITLGPIPSGAQPAIQTTVTVSPPAGYGNATVGISRFQNNGAGWLSVDKSQLDTTSTFKVTVATSALTAGTYTGSVALQFINIGSPFQEVDLAVSVTVVTMVSVPNVVGSTQGAATSAIQGVGLVLGTVSSASSPTVPAGSVISQNPASGTQVALGSAVSLTVSTGPGTVSVPNVTGLTQVAGASAIQSAGLTLGTVTNASSATVPAGTIISQNPASGTQVALGSAVNLTVSTGNIPVTIDTSPSGLLVVVDNVTYTAPHTFDWVPANPHNISAPSPQTQNGTQFTFSNWSNGGLATQQVTPLSAVTYTATYTGAPVSRVLSHLVAGGEWTTGILVINKGNAQAQFSITFYGNTGVTVALPFNTGSTSVLSGAVAALGSAYFEASDPNISFITGWGKVTADPSLVIQAIFRRKVSPTRYYEAAVPTTSSATDFTFPFDATTFADGGVPFFTGITFSNQDSGQIATVNCTARDTAGTVIPNAIGVITMSPLGHYSDFLFPGLTGKRGTIRCTSNTTVSTIPLRFIGVDAFSTLPVVDPNQVLTPGTRALSHLASGGEWTTGIEILNTGDTTAQYSIAFYSNTGLPVALPFSGGSLSVLTGTLPPRGSTYVEASNPNIPNGQVISAWGRVTADSSIVVQAIFRRNVSQIFYEAGVSSSFGSSSFIVPFDATLFTDANLPFYTGFAVANLDGSLAADITCVTRDSTGTLMPNAVTVPQLAPFGHWAEFLFPALAGKRGTINCTSNRTVATTVLRFIGVDGFSTLPIILP